ncbi:MAG: corrinoid protein [Nitrospirota bacterium]
MNSIYQLRCAIIKGNIKKVTTITEKCLQDGFVPSTIIEQGILKAMGVVEEKWKTYEYFIPNVLVSAITIKLCLNVLRSSFRSSIDTPIGKAVAGTVRGDIHDIGKNMVVMFMEGAGFEVVDLGVDVSPENFIKAIKKEKADILLLSCLYTVTMHVMEDTIISLKKAGLRERVKTLVGGAPITQEFADCIGADGFGVDAMEAVRKAKDLLQVDSYDGLLRYDKKIFS